MRPSPSHRAWASSAVLLLGACGRLATPAPGDGTGGQSTGGDSNDGGPASGAATAAGGQSSAGGTEPTGSGGSDGALGGAGSGGASTFCPGIVPECEPHEAGCNERGETYTCSECGVMEPGGEACVRLLASDKEFGLVCTVRGEKELRCAAGTEDWSPDIEHPTELPEFPTALRLPDDATSFSQELAYCWLDEDGDIECGEHDQFSSGAAAVTLGDSGCIDLALSDHPVACAICAGQLECEGEGSAVSAGDVRQVGLSDTNVFWLTNSGSIYYQIEQEAPFLPGSYSFLFVDDNVTPCGIREDGALVCASWDDEEPTLELGGEFITGSGAGEHRCVVGRDGTITCVRVVEGAFEPVFAPAGSDFVEVAMSSNKSCARTRLGTVVCWNDEGLLDWLAAQLN